MKKCTKGKKTSRVHMDLQALVDELENEDREPLGGGAGCVVPDDVRERVLEHAERHDGVLQISVFFDCIQHLPPLYKDVRTEIEKRVMSRGPLFLFGGLIVENDELVASDSSFKLVDGELIELSPMPSSRFHASAVYFEGEILLVGGFQSPAQEIARLKDREAPDFHFFNHPRSGCLTVAAYNIAEDDWREIPVLQISPVLIGYVSCQIFEGVIFVCGMSGRDVAIDAATLKETTKFRMPQRGVTSSFHTQTVMTSNGLLFCWTVSTCSVFNKSSSCCNFLFVLDVKALLKVRVLHELVSC